jgi:hypothetical protein
LCRTIWAEVDAESRENDMDQLDPESRPNDFHDVDPELEENALNRERLVRKRAYAIWEIEGRRSGEDIDHWMRAQNFIRNVPMDESIED